GPAVPPAAPEARRLPSLRSPSPPDPLPNSPAPVIVSATPACSECAPRGVRPASRKGGRSMRRTGRPPVVGALVAPAAVVVVGQVRMFPGPPTDTNPRANTANDPYL